MDSLRQNTEEIIRLMERDKSCFLQKNIIKAFRELGMKKKTNT